MKRIILFGAGSYGEKALHEYGVQDVGFFSDNNPALWGKNYLGKEVISPAKLQEIADNYNVVLSVNGYEPIVKQLNSLGIKIADIYLPNLSKAIEMIRSLLSVKKCMLVNEDSTDTEWILNRLGLNKKTDAMTIKAIGDIGDNPDVDCFVIAQFNNHQAIKAYLKKKFKGKEIIDPFQKRFFHGTAKIVSDRYNGNQQNSEFKASGTDIARVNRFVELVGPEPPFFEYIEVETINRCNGTCAFCPVNKNVEKRELAIMTEELFKSIVDQLADLEYDGVFSPYSNNDPIMDKRIVELCKYAKAKLLKAHIAIYTNGLLLTIEKFQQLIECLDELVIDNYDLQLTPISLAIKEYVENHPELLSKVTISIRDPNEVMTTRGGNAPNRSGSLSSEYGKDKCALPFRQMVVRPDGKVSLCCNDALGQVTLGDLNEHTIADVWWGEPYRNVRKLLSGGRENLELCKKCDTFLLH